jgi:hypothetical protein
VRGIAVRFAAFSGLSDLVPLYPLYALLFADNGLSGGQIATLFVLWSAASLVLEVPSGALADVVSRRALLFAGAQLHAVGFALWTFAPGYASFAAGFVLWAAGSALQSGTLEALVYDELAAIGSESEYQRLSARAQTTELAMMMAGSLAAAPLFAAGGYLAVGVVSVATASCAGLVGLTFPQRARPGGGAEPDGETETADDGPRGVRAWLGMLRAGVGEAAGVRSVRRLVLLAALLPGFGAMDEFFPLLATHTGAATTLVPVLMVVIAVGQLAGGATASWPLRGSVVGLATMAGGVAIVAGALSGSPWGLLAVAAGYGMWQHAVVVTDARLQAAVTGPARATVTSVAGLGAEMAAISLYVPWGFMVGRLGDGWAVALTAWPLVAIGVLAAGWLGDPPGRATRPAPDVREP